MLNIGNILFKMLIISANALLLYLIAEQIYLNWKDIKESIKQIIKILISKQFWKYVISFKWVSKRRK